MSVIQKIPLYLYVYIFVKEIHKIRILMLRSFRQPFAPNSEDTPIGNIYWKKSYLFIHITLQRFQHWWRDHWETSYNKNLFIRGEGSSGEHLLFFALQMLPRQPNWCHHFSSHLQEEWDRLSGSPPRAGLARLKAARNARRWWYHTPPSVLRESSKLHEEE